MYSIGERCLLECSMSVHVLSVVFLKTVNPEDDSKNFGNFFLSSSNRSNKIIVCCVLVIVIERLHSTD